MAQSLLMVSAHALANSSPIKLQFQSSPAPLTSTTLLRTVSSRRLSQFKLLAAPGKLLGVEPDLNEDYIPGSEHWTTGQDEEEFFPYGKIDGSHAWHEEDENQTFIEAVSAQIKDAGGPNDHPVQATISWLFLPVIFSGLAFGVQHEYLFLVCVLFIFAFIGIEMDKPDKPNNIEPEVSRRRNEPL